MTESYRKFLDEDHHHHHYHHPLVLLPLHHHMNFEKLVIIANGHFLCLIFLFLYRRTSLPKAHTEYYYSLSLNSPFSLCD